MKKSYKTFSFITCLICLLYSAISYSADTETPSDIPSPPSTEALGTIIFEGKGSSKDLPSSHFPHWKHRIHYRCSVCHEKIFIMKKGANKMSMKLFKQGKFCGECHNGKEAYRIGFGTCNRCHKKITDTKPKP